MAAAMVSSMLVGGFLASLLTPREVFAGTGLLGLALPLAVAPALLRSSPRSDMRSLTRSE